MKLRLTRTLHLLTSLMLLAALTACGGGGSGSSSFSNGSSFTEAQIKEFDDSSKSISEKLSNAAEPGSETALNDAKNFALTLPNIESASVVDGNLEVKYKGGGREVWIKKAPTPTIPADIPENMTQTTKSVSARNVTMKGVVGNRKAVLINTLYDDPSYASHKENFTGMKKSLERAGFIVTELYGSDGTLEKLGQLSQYSVLVYNGHGTGSLNGTEYLMSTAILWDWVKYPDVKTLWTEDMMTRMNIDYGPSYNTYKLAVFAMTGKYLRLKYGNNNFNNALFLSSSCKGAKYDSFMKVLSDIGIAAYAGWSWYNSNGNSTNERMIELMAGGKTIREAYEALPLFYKRDMLTAFVSKFTLSPYSDASLTLGGINTSHPEIRFDSPSNSSSIADRRCVVKGQIIPNTGYFFANIIVNGQSEVLSVNPDGSFEQAVGLRAGENLITVATRGGVEYQKSVIVTGVFSSDILFTTLWWNTDLSDVDLHLVPIEGVDGLRDDCFFANMISTWGATLDVDDTDGYGPEHITARTLPPGTYLLYVHYYETHGQTSPTVVNVSVSVNGQQSEIFSLGGNRRMVAEGDIWNVCTIEFPSGKITSINEFLPAAKAAGRQPLTDKRTVKSVSR